MDLFETSGADFSYDRKHRYKLWRIWDNGLPLAMVIGLNPSTANETKTDATITHLTAMLKILGYGGVYMMNCWSYVSSNPKLIKSNPFSDEWNSNTIIMVAGKCKDVIFAWGSFPIIREKCKDKEFEEMFPNALCFGRNKNSTPMHPLAMMYAGLTKKPKLIMYNSIQQVNERVG